MLWHTIHLSGTHLGLVPNHRVHVGGFHVQRLQAGQPAALLVHTEVQGVPADQRQVPKNREERRSADAALLDGTRIC